MENKLITNFNKLNIKERDFLKWCNENEDSLLLPIREIGNKYGVGMSFIYSLLKKLEIGSFKELIMLLEKKINSLDSDIQYLLRQGNKSIFASLFTLHLNSDLSNYTLLRGQQDKIDQFCNYLVKAKNVFAMGLGHAYLALKDFESFYKWVNPKFRVLDNMSFSLNVKESKLVFIYSMRSKNSKLLEMVKKARETENLKIVIFTSNIDSKVASLCDVIIEVHNIMKKQDLFIDYKILSPINTWIYLNNIIKTNLFKNNKEDLLKVEGFNREIISWEKNSYW